MASKPGLFTQWPWQKLGNFKYVMLVPMVANSAYKLATAVKNGEEKDLVNLTIFPTLLLRLLLGQLWISWSRFQTASGKHRIVHKGLEFDQVDRERNWDDQILLTAILYYSFNAVDPRASYLPWWDTKGVIVTVLLHVGPVEFLYYWLHRALHHHYLYSRYHSHHHSSIVTEPITSVIHPFAEELAYFFLFAIPMSSTVYIVGRGSIASLVGYIFYIDFMNYMGHCNFELVPKGLFDAFPPLKYLMYTPSYHSLHHTQFRTNYSLFMPLYDYIYGTMDKSSDELYENSLKGMEEAPHVLHLTHMTSLQSIYHLRLGFASLASIPYTPKWYMWMLCPLTYGSMLLTWIYGSVFTVERNRLKKLKIQTWAIPRYSFQYTLSQEREVINNLIENAILEAQERGVTVISLGLLNQGEELNRNGELYLQKHPKLKVRIVDGSSLAVAVVLNNIPQGTKEVLLRGKLTKTACVLALVLCQKGIQVLMVQKDEHKLLKLQLPPEYGNHLVFSTTYTCEVWVVGDGLRDEEQQNATKSTHFIPFSQFPPRKVRKDCIYHSTPAMMIPKEFENMHSCENWLPRKVISAWRIAGIVHALEGSTTHECGDTVLDIEKVWRATLDHGFSPFDDAL